MPEPLNILQLTPRLPFPLMDGGAIGIFNITRSLAGLGHRVTMVSYPHDDEKETAEAFAAIQEFATVKLVGKPLPPRWKTLIRSAFRGAYPIERRMMPEMFALLKNIVEKERFDVVHVDHAHMGRYGLWLKEAYGLPVVLREHNFECQIYERFADVESNPAKRLVARVHGKRLRKEETSFLRRFDAIAAISNEDLAMMRAAAPDAQYRVIPAGVDTEYFRMCRPENEQYGTILWIGTLAWDPNFDAIRHFLREILPRIQSSIPAMRFDVVGSDTDRLKKEAEPFGASVKLHGRVHDVRDYLERSAVLVVPLRIGGGMRLKLLEFFSAGKAVVSTRIGAEGNRAHDGIEVLLRDSDEDFASAVITLLDDPEQRKRLGCSARELVQRYYSWEHIAEEFTELYCQVVSSRSIPEPGPRSPS